MRKFTLAVAALMLVGAVTGCATDKVTEPKITAAGSWIGNVLATDGSPYTLGFVLVENTGVVTGSGSLTGSTAVALTASGTYSAPTIGLTLSSPGFQPMNMTATVGKITMTGSLNGSGFTNASVSLTRN